MREAMDNSKDNQTSKEPPEQPKGEAEPTVLNPSYQRKEQYALTDEDRKAITEAVASLDRENIRFQRTLTPAERFHITRVMIAVTEQNAVNHLRQIVPELDEREALYMVRGGRKNFLWQRYKDE